MSNPPTTPTTLHITPEHGPREPIMRSSVFSLAPDRWILRVWAPNDRRGEAEYPTQDAAMGGVRALYAATGIRPVVNNTSDSGRVRLCSASRKDVTEDLVAALEVLLSHAPTAPAWAIEKAGALIKEVKGQS